MKDGGQVPGSGPNKDTVPAMLAPGEFVMSRGAVSKYGADTMESMNAMGGGTNRPMIKDGITYALQMYTLSFELKQVCNNNMQYYRWSSNSARSDLNNTFQ